MVNNPTEVNDFHADSDVDVAVNSQHHTLGYGLNQAAPGPSVQRRLTVLEKFIVSSAGSGKLVIGNQMFQWGSVTLTFTAASFTQPVTFGTAYSTAPTVAFAIINGGSGSSTFFSQAVSLTATGLSVLVVQRAGTSTAVSGMPVSWLAIGPV